MQNLPRFFVDPIVSPVPNIVYCHEILEMFWRKTKGIEKTKNNVVLLKYSVMVSRHTSRFLCLGCCGPPVVIDLPEFFYLFYSVVLRSVFFC